MNEGGLRLLVDLGGSLDGSAGEPDSELFPRQDVDYGRAEIGWVGWVNRLCVLLSSRRWERKGNAFL